MKASEHLSGISDMLVATGHAFGQMSNELELLEVRLNNIETQQDILNHKLSKQREILLKIKDCITELEREA